MPCLPILNCKSGTIEIQSPNFSGKRFKHRGSLENFLPQFQHFRILGLGIVVGLFVKMGKKKMNRTVTFKHTV
jgi:hypothetical protein